MMPARRFWASGYRSLHDFRIDLQTINLIVGANGSGKTNLYRALQLLQCAAQGQLARGLAEEGGMPSALWAGERKQGAVRMTVGVELDTLSYEMSCGLPQNTFPTMFGLDPLIKTETVGARHGSRKVTLVERENLSVVARDVEGTRVTYPIALSQSESVLSQIREPHRFPELSALRDEILRWRFYHSFRTDLESPVRSPQIGVRTPILSHDGNDLAAALQTIIEAGEDDALREAISRAFPGSALSVVLSESGMFGVELEMPGIRRPLAAKELSDGMLRYLCLTAALLSQDPPPLLVLNEPETSLHPDLFEPLAAMIVSRSERSQIVVTTHSDSFASKIESLGSIKRVTLEKVDGETTIAPPIDD